MSETNKPTLDKNVLALKEVISKNLETKGSGVYTVSKGGFEDTLADIGIESGVVKKIANHRNDYLLALGLAVGEKGIDDFKGDKDLKQVSVECKLETGDVMGAVFSRERNLPSKDGGMESRKGVLSLNYRTSGQSPTRTKTQNVKKHLRDLAMKEL